MRLGGDFIESQFEEHEGEQSIRKLLSEHVPGTMLEDLKVNADLETTRTTWSIWLRDRHLLEDQAPCSDGDYLTVALDHVVSLKERMTEGQRFEHIVGEIELTKRVNAIPEDEGFTKERKMELDRMKTQIEDFMNDNPGLFSKLKPRGKLSAYFDWTSPRVAGAVHTKLGKVHSCTAIPSFPNDPYICAKGCASHRMFNSRLMQHLPVAGSCLQWRNAMRQQMDF